MTIAVLAVQGAFIEHEKMLASLGIEYFEIRNRKDLDKHFDGIIFPGGESTVMGKLLRELKMAKPLSEQIVAGLPVFGTCAGLLLLAEKISGGELTYFSSMPIVAKRNAYGRQMGSFKTTGNFTGIGEIPMVFIRAPYIEEAGQDVEVLASIGNHIVAAQHGNKLVTAFHPEMTENPSVHKYFLNIVTRSIKKIKGAVWTAPSQTEDKG